MGCSRLGLLPSYISITVELLSAVANISSRTHGLSLISKIIYYTERIEAVEFLQFLLRRKNEISDIDTIRSVIRFGNRNLTYNNGTYDALVNTGLLYNIESTPKSQHTL